MSEVIVVVGEHLRYHRLQNAVSLVYDFFNRLSCGQMCLGEGIAIS
jgi:hypothetical protein